jgi:hypothetical protein
MTDQASRIATAIATVLLSALEMGCSSLVPFTHEIRTQNNLTDQDLQQLQFYVSHDVTLRREVHSTGRDISEGHLKLRSGKTIEEVVIEEHTPGVAMAISYEAITVSFEEGSALQFGLRTGEPLPAREGPPSIGGFAEPPEPFPGDDHVAPHEPMTDLYGNYWLDANSDSLVVFQGKQWETVEQSFRTHLMIDAESLEEVVESRTTLKGRRLSKAPRKPPLIVF